ncbi:MAG: hypothetical protein AAB594_01420 [Patescibacteria group bacterium]
MKKFFKRLLWWTVIIILIIVFLRILNSLNFSGTSGVLTLVSFLLAPVCLLIGGIYLLKFVLRKKDNPSKTAEPEKGTGKEKPKAPEKKPWLVRILVTLGILALLIYGGVKLLSSNDVRNQLASQSLRQTSIDTLGCSTGGYIEPNHRGTTRYVVMPRGCWTDVIYQPNINGYLSKRFAIDPKGKITAQFGFGGERWLDPYETDPGSNRKFKGTTTVRFKNSGKQPVVVDIITG